MVLFQLDEQGHRCNEIKALLDNGIWSCDQYRTAMADKLHCSESTIERKLRELGLSRRGTQTVNRTTSTDESVNQADSGQEITEDELPF